MSINTLAIELADFLVDDKSISAPGNEPRPKHGAIGGELTILPLPLCSWITSAADTTCIFFSSGKRIQLLCLMVSIVYLMKLACLYFYTG